jgi:hypothetical protein
MPERLSKLPTFTMVGDDNEINLWPVSGPVGYTEGNNIGRARAADLVEVMRRTNSPVLLAHVIEAIVNRGEIGAVETGFFHAISKELLTPHILTEFVTVPPERQFRVGRQVGHLKVVANEDLEAHEPTKPRAIAVR